MLSQPVEGWHGFFFFLSEGKFCSFIEVAWDANVDSIKASYFTWAVNDLGKSVFYVYFTESFVKKFVVKSNS